MKRLFLGLGLVLAGCGQHDPNMVYMPPVPGELENVIWLEPPAEATASQ